MDLPSLILQNPEEFVENYSHSHTVTAPGWVQMEKQWPEFHQVSPTWMSQSWSIAAYNMANPSMTFTHSRREAA